MKRSLVAVLGGLLFPFMMKAQDDSVMIRQIVEDVLIRGEAYENLRFICKKIGPRLSGSPQGAKAVTETARMMREMGADTVYLQECMVPKWVRKGRDTASLIMANGKGQPLRITALGNSEGTSASGIKASVIEVRDFDELERMKDQVKGKIVFYNHPMNPRYIETFRAYGAAGQYRGQGASRAAKYGAVGVIIRSLASNPDDYPHTGAMRYDTAFAKIPAVAISTNDADLLSSALMKKMVSQVYIKAECGMQGEVLSHNVVGEIRGSEFPDEIITVGGHIDSWDLAEGAHDDGAGCVQSIEIIRVMKALGIKPKRTIRAVMFMNEENGLRGGTKYAELAKAENKKFIFALESDAGGFVPRGFGFTAKPEQITKIFAWKPLFQPYGADNFNVGGGGADIGPLRPLGTVMAGLNPDSQRYFDVHHASSDVFEAVSPRELNLGAVAMAGLVYMVSQYGL